MTEPIRPQKITIQQGEGLTQALQKLVKSMPNSIMTDGNISASEWNATMDALVEIQNERKNNGGEAIFSGGTDKTKSGWKNSFVVQAGQVIEFTSAEITKLFKAMGVNINAAPPVSDADGTPPASETSKKPNDNEVTMPAKVGLNPPTTDAKPPKNSPEQMVLPQNLTPSNECFPDRAGQTKKEGPLFNRRTVTYDENGYISKVKTKHYELSISRDEKGSPTDYSKLTYVENNARLDYYDSNAKPDGFWTATFNQDNKLTREIKRTKEGYVILYYDYEYDEKGNEIRKTTRNIGGYVVEYEDIEYDTNGLKRVAVRDKDGKLKQYNVYDSETSYHIYYPED